MQDDQGTSNAKNRANELTGADWTRFSISVWNDIRKTTDETQLKHPAMFPTALTTRLIRCFAAPGDVTVLDPFMGSGSTLVSAQMMGKQGIGFDTSAAYIALAERRLQQGGLFTERLTPVIHNLDARKLDTVLGQASVDMCITSPPYWDILSQKRTADYKAVRDYGAEDSDLSLLHDYRQFLDALGEVFRGVYNVLRPGKYCIVNVMDLRKKDQFFPYHCDLAQKMTGLGFKWDDLIVWDRRQEYNNLRSLGYPYVFRLNKIHEYLLIFQKPRASVSDRHPGKE